MKRLVCRKCGGSFFEFRRNSSFFQCHKCKNPIEIMDFDEKNNKKIDYISISWKNVIN